VYLIHPAVKNWHRRRSAFSAFKGLAGELRPSPLVITLDLLTWRVIMKKMIKSFACRATEAVFNDGRHQNCRQRFRRPRGGN